MNDYTKELCHWGVKLGAEREGHKYLARVEGRKPGSYRYFYDLEKFNRWKSKAADKGRQLQSDWRSGVNSIKNQASKLTKENVSYSVAEPISRENAKRFAESLINKISKETPFVRTPKTELSIKYGKSKVASLLSKLPFIKNTSR